MPFEFSRQQYHEQKDFFEAMFLVAMDGILLVYDVSLEVTFTAMEQMYNWIPKRRANPEGSIKFKGIKPPLERLPVVLVGCKKAADSPIRVTDLKVAEFKVRHPEVTVAEIATPSNGENVGAAVDLLLESVEKLLLAERGMENPNEDPTGKNDAQSNKQGFKNIMKRIFKSDS